ncbi:MAG: Acyl-CoA thioesterase YbgC [Stenotrophomonas maltophilia]|uniref:Acyl-CoA thioesterase YbgC n=1 Tax=Stenotrophomonas maltophilia TaxID=40324 RepID=A0A7V8FFA7_STEMA|nr:MAG: Acyl-CoA thioesterase YbgC [Stenotrophomonas maltophilia]
MVESRFSWPTRIYWEDTDAGGVVYHARYVAFMERARTEWMRSLGFGQERMRSAFGLIFAVRAMQLDFLKPARLDDVLQVGVTLVQLKRASMVLDQQIRCEGQLLLTAKVRIAALEAATFRPRGMDDAVLAALQPHLHPESEH